MAKIHVLQSTPDGFFNVVLHSPVLAGNNQAGFTWKDVLLNSQRSGSTSLTVGTGAGQISTAENAQVLAGDVLELATQLKVDVKARGANLQNAMTALADKAINNNNVRLQRELIFYGATQG